MSKPVWFNEATEEAKKSNYETLTPGGHRCVIREIHPTKTKDMTKSMWIIYFDTAPEDAQPNFFADNYARQTGDKTWKGRMWYIVDETASSQNKDGSVSFYGRTNLAKFITAVEESNPMFQTDWTEHYMYQNYLDQFRGKRIGIVFGIERYTDDVTLELRTTVKPKYFRAVDKVEEAKIPKEKDSGKAAVKPPNAASAEGFMNIADDLEDEGLPFNQ